MPQLEVKEGGREEGREERREKGVGSEADSVDITDNHVFAISIFLFHGVLD